MARIIIGLSGYAGSGKDAIGAVLAHRGYERRAFADPLKDVARRIGWDGEKDDAGRTLLQELGSAVRDVLGATTWVDAALAAMPERVVVTDVRYRNEAAAIKEAGGRIVRVVRPGYGPANAHGSEVDLDGWPFDAVIPNTGSLVELRRKVHRLADRIEGFNRYGTRRGEGEHVEARFVAECAADEEARADRRAAAHITLERPDWCADLTVPDLAPNRKVTRWDQT